MELKDVCDDLWAEFAEGWDGEGVVMEYESFVEAITKYREELTIKEHQ